MSRIAEQVQEIKGQFRYFMNGTTSQLMREKGLVYRVNFGLEYPRIKEIAGRYEKNHHLAQALWKEDIREAKILATLLQPYETFYPEIADIWVESIFNIEIAEQACMNLFQYLDYAPAKAFEWLADDREYVQPCGFMVVAWLLKKGREMNERAVNELIDQAISAIHSTSYASSKSACLALRKFALQSTANAELLLKRLDEEGSGSGEKIVALIGEIKKGLEY